MLPHQHTSERVHHLWLVLPQRGWPGKYKGGPAPRDVTWTWGRSHHPHQCWGTGILIINAFYWKICNQNEKWWENLHTVRYGEVILAYTQLNLTDQSGLLFRPFRHGLYICFDLEEGNAFENRNGVAVLQTFKVKLGGPRGCDFRQVLVSLRTQILSCVILGRPPTVLQAVYAGSWHLQPYNLKVSCF